MIEFFTTFCRIKKSNEKNIILGKDFGIEDARVA